MNPWLIGIGVEFGGVASCFDLRLSYAADDVAFGFGGGAADDPRLGYTFDVREWTVSLGYVVLAANGKAAPSNRLDTEFGYGLPVFGDRFTGTLNVGFGMSEAARDWRIRWRLNPAAPNASGFEVSLDAVRREPANDNGAEHGVMLRSLLRW